ncbi:MAG: hypothetical protein QM802_05375 [Agriterribacter sp.]
MSKIFYSTFSFIQSLLLLVFRMLYITAAGIAIFHYYYNPVVTTIVACICLLFFVITGPDKIIVYADGLKYSDGTLFKIFRQNKYYAISNLKSFKIKGDFTTADELNTKPISWQTKPLNTVFIEFKDGTVETFKTNIYKDKLNRVSEEVATLIDKKQNNYN